MLSNLTGWGGGSADENRQGVADERAVRRRSSDPLRPRVMRRLPRGEGEALTEGSAGWPLSRENVDIQGADAVLWSGRPHRVSRQREAHSNPARSKTPCTHGHSLRGNREIPHPPREMAPGPRPEPRRDTRSANGCGKSDRFIVPRKPTNKDAGTPVAAELVEGRSLAKGNTADKTGPGHRPGQVRPNDAAGVRQAMEWVVPAKSHIRLRVTHPRQEPGAVVPHAGICAGGRG